MNTINNTDTQEKKIIYFPSLDKNSITDLKAHEFVYISGTIYTARDAAHERIIKLIENSESLPFDFENNIVYYAGPSPKKDGQVVGSIGPTTSGRMDSYSTVLMEHSLIYMIGKGIRNNSVIEAIKKHKGLYLSTIGGAGAYIANCVKSIEVIAFDDLGTEAIHKLVVEELPAVVAVDCMGNSIY